MASSFHMLAAGFCLLIVCAARLSLTAPANDSPEGEESGHEDFHADATETAVTTNNNRTEAAQQTSPKTTAKDESPIAGSSSPAKSVTSNKPQTPSVQAAATEAPTKAETKSTTVRANSTVTSATSTSTATTEAAEVTKQDVDKPTTKNQNEPVVAVPDPEPWLPWSHSTWASVIIPVSVGLGAALFLIAWICCVRRVCCRRCGRWRSPPYKDRNRSISGPPKKALREDFRQLRAKDRMKLLAESSDEEF